VCLVVKFSKKSSIFLEHSCQVWYNYNRHRYGRVGGPEAQIPLYLAPSFGRGHPRSPEGQAFVSADTSHKLLFGKKGKVLNLCNLYFDIVSYFVLRISDFSMPYNSLQNMKIKSTTNNQLPITSYHLAFGTSTTVERSLQIHLFLTNKANFQKSQINVSSYITGEYGKMDTWSSGKNKAKTNPIQSQFKPNTNPIQTQYKPKQTQFQTLSGKNGAHELKYIDR